MLKSGRLDPQNWLARRTTTARRRHIGAAET